MKCLHIITPVKDSIDSTLETVKAIMNSVITVPFRYTIYNDFSTEENTRRLEAASRELGFRLVNLSDITDHPIAQLLAGVAAGPRGSYCSRGRLVDCGIGCSGTSGYLASFI